MTHEHDRLEQELAALRPAEPSAELAARIGARLAAEAATVTKSNGTRSVPATFWLAPAGAIAAVVLAGVVWWSMRRELPPVEMPTDLPQPTLATALDETLPTVWAFRPAVESPESLDRLLDKHARLAPAAGEPVQTRSFGPVTMNLNSRLGGL
jgi:hypothetical protein